MEPNLVERAQTGDERAFEALTVTWHPRLFRVAFGVLRDAAMAEDAAQRTFLEIWRWLPRLGDTDRFESWALGHLVRTCAVLEAEREDEEGSDTMPDVIDVDSLGAFIDRDQLSRGFRRLRFDDRAVLVLHFLAELDDEVAGPALGLKAEAVQARTNVALEKLDALLDGDTVSASELKPQAEGA